MKAIEALDRIQADTQVDRCDCIPGSCKCEWSDFDVIREALSPRPAQAGGVDDLAREIFEAFGQSYELAAPSNRVRIRKILSKGLIAGEGK